MAKRGIGGKQGSVDVPDPLGPSERSAQAIPAGQRPGMVAAAYRFFLPLTCFFAMSGVPGDDATSVGVPAGDATVQPDPSIGRRGRWRNGAYGASASGAKCAGHCFSARLSRLRPAQYKLISCPSGSFRYA